ncbi:ras guanine nucleotide exchange factor domain-containing protein [Jimgerdemannia flammicorona]|uniref:Ras guanine nucleotide exchange factor domain-containing protein n=1 Tax=Jimgerdemannia flammicorona TaxID=994334 RepID=A0A433DLP2_9FUNG|nr:ras guanine nucleotide exchange factor domain-containing protein [Jimgerdemannia flammicorona]
MSPISELPPKSENRVLDVLARWVKLQYEDFHGNPSLRRNLETFLNSDVRHAGFTGEADRIKRVLALQVCGHFRTSIHQTRYRHNRVLPFQPSHQFPSHVQSLSAPSSPGHTATTFANVSLQRRRRPSTSSFISFNSITSMGSTSSTAPNSPDIQGSPLLELDARDVAKYLTLADFHLFKSITAYEYVHGQWRIEKEKRVSTEGPLIDNRVEELTKRSNMLSHWVAHEICSARTIKGRRAMVKKFIDIAKNCRVMNNFHTCMFVVTGLTSRPVQRLDDVWKVRSKSNLTLIPLNKSLYQRIQNSILSTQTISSRDLATLHSLENLLNLSQNMSNYRRSFQKAKSPAIPFFPLVLKDVTFFIDGNKTFVEAEPDLPTHTNDTYATAEAEPRSSALVVNFEKFRGLANHVNRTVTYAAESYSFAGQLETCPFLVPLPMGQSVCASLPTSPLGSPSLFPAAPLNRVAEIVEARLRAVAGCMNDQGCDARLVALSQIDLN